MIKNCPICGKAFDVLYPDLWRYKRRNGNELFICSWGCIRKYDKGKEEEKTMAMMKKDGTPAKKPGPKPKKKIEIPEQVPVVKVDGPLKIETPEAKNVLVETPEHIDRVFPDASVEAQMPKEQIAKVGKKGFFLPAYIQGFEIVGVKGQYGIYRASEEHNYFEFQPFGGDLCMNPQDWAEQMKELKKAARVLGVEL